MLDNLKKILEEVIYKLEDKKNNLTNNSSFNKYNEELTKLEESYTNIVDIDLEVIKNILSELPFTADEQKVLYKFIESIKTLLLLNKNKNTTFTISEQQIKHLNIFLNKVKEVKHQEEVKLQEEIDRKLNSYKELLNKISNEKNTSFIKELDLLEEMFNEFDIDITLRKQVLIDILMYNKNLF